MHVYIACIWVVTYTYLDFSSIYYIYVLFYYNLQQLIYKWVIYVYKVIGPGENLHVYTYICNVNRDWTNCNM